MDGFGNLGGQSRTLVSLWTVSVGWLVSLETSVTVDDCEKCLSTLGAAQVSLIRNIKTFAKRLCLLLKSALKTPVH